MIAIISRADENGNFPEIGLNNRVILKGYKTLKGIMYFARHYAQGKHYQIELFPDNGIYKDPVRIIRN